MRGKPVVKVGRSPERGRVNNYTIEITTDTQISKMIKLMSKLEKILNDSGQTVAYISVLLEGEESEREE